MQCYVKISRSTTIEKIMMAVGYLRVAAKQPMRLKKIPELIKDHKYSLSVYGSSVRQKAFA